VFAVFPGGSDITKAAAPMLGGSPLQRLADRPGGQGGGTPKSDKMDAVDKKYRSKLRDVLTPAPQAEWDKIKSEYKAKMKGAH
jgi:hypothetical protein